MNNKFYRSRPMKGLIWFLTCGFLCVFILCGCFLSYMLSKDQSPIQMADTYTESTMFADDLNTAALKITSSYSNVSRFSSLTDSSDMIDLDEVLNDQPLSGKNTSGLAYSFSDLKQWAADDWSYDSDPSHTIVICEKEDGTKDYFRFSDFSDQLKNGTLTFQYNQQFLHDDVWTEKEVYDTIMEELEYDYVETDFFAKALNGIYDGDKNTLKYVSVSSCAQTPIVEAFSPDGADSLLDVLNNTSGWNDRVSDALNALEKTLSLVSAYFDSEQTLQEYKTDSNLTWLLVDNEGKKAFSNQEISYTSTASLLSKMKQAPVYLLTDSDHSFETVGTAISNTGHGILSVAAWLQDMDSHLTLSDYTFAMAVDTGYPAADVFSAHADAYQICQKWARPALAGFAAGLILTLIGFLWLCFNAGKTSKDDQIHLTFADRWFTEIYTAVIFLLWFLPLSYVTSYISLSTLYRSTQNGSKAHAFVLTLLLLYTFVLILSFVLGMIRRIQTKSLWKDSLTCKIFTLIRLFFRKIWNFLSLYFTNTALKITLTLELAVFLLFQFILSILAVNSPPFIFLLLLFVDAATLIWMIKKADGQDQITLGLKRITEGDLQYKIPTDRLKGNQKRTAEYINNIGSGLDAAVDKSLRDERLKTELVTNVSHDIKTPLTSIINYISLLKQENLTDPKICGYLDVLDQKAHRLKTLTEDVVEASKISTGNVSLNIQPLNFTELTQQVCGEFQEQFQSRQLTIVTLFSAARPTIQADGQKMWRVLSNLFTNIYKYALEGTRVYISLENQGAEVVFTAKNISSQALNFSADELTERFIRGDISRSTEGSGLGLSIAKTLTELQKGTFHLHLDGDLFKVMITFPVAEAPEEK
nr:HAMP domain-containing sensor histidine kinase [uncultured Blautia sp.]